MKVEQLAVGILAIDGALLAGALGSHLGVLDFGGVFWGYLSLLFTILTLLGGTLLLLIVEG